MSFFSRFTRRGRTDNDNPSSGVDSQKKKMDGYKTYLDDLQHVENGVNSNPLISTTFKDRIMGTINSTREAVLESLSNTCEKHPECYETYESVLMKLTGDMLEKLSNASPESLAELQKKLEEAPDDKPKRIIIKAENAKERMKLIKNLTENFPLSLITDMGDDKILISFKKHRDCETFKDIIFTRFEGFQLFEEQDHDAEILISNPNNIPTEDILGGIENITKEKPEVVRVVELEGDQTRVELKLTSHAMLQLQAENNSTITIGDTKFHYHQVPDWFRRVGFGREHGLVLKY